MADIADEKTAIVGGGIAGLFCALVLMQQGKSFTLFEATERFGGRIRTVRLNKANSPLGKNWKQAELEFYAEFGPMRVELDKQRLLKALLTYLGIKARATGEVVGNAFLSVFPAYASPSSILDPRYELRPEEASKTPLQLLRLALLRITAHLEVLGKSTFLEKKEELIKRITVAAATQEPVDPIFVDWMKGLSSEHYW